MASKASIVKLAGIYIRRLEQNGFPIARAYLYGSHTKGTSHPASDIDVAVVTSRAISDNLDKRTKVRSLAWDIDDRLEVVIFPPERFEDWHPLVHEIKTTGIRLK